MGLSKRKDHEAKELAIEVVVDNVQLGLGQTFVAEQQVDAEAKEENDGIAAVAEDVVKVVVRNHVCIPFVRNQRQHDEIGRVIAEVEEE